MDNKEKIVKLLETVPEYKLGYILAFIQGITADELADDDYCEELYQNYLNDKDLEKDQMFSIEDCKKEWEIS